jgi:hypothetical protein
VIHQFERSQAIEDTIQLSEFTDVAARVQGRRNVGVQGIADFVRLVSQIAGHNVMAALTQLGH